jgi:hypothetical protein
MSTEAGKKAMNGEWVEVTIDRFEITQKMSMTFEGRSCNIEDEDGELVVALGAKDGNVTKEVQKGYLCYVMRAKVKFEKVE